MKKEFKYLRAQWHSQPKISGGSKCLILGEQQCFDYCLLKHKMVTYSKNLEGLCPPVPLGYAYARMVYTTYM